MNLIKNTFILIIFSLSLLACSESSTGISENQKPNMTLDKKASEALEARIRKLEDVHEIKNIQAQYSYLIDTVQMEALADLFADDFVWEGGFDKNSMNTVTSKPQLLKLLKKAAEATTMIRHQATTPYIKVEGDNAKGTWYVLGMMTAITPEGKVAKWVQGRLDNEYIRINGEWKISRKSTTYNFNTPYEESWANMKKPDSASFFEDSDDSK